MRTQPVTPTAASSHFDAENPPPRNHPAVLSQQGGGSQGADTAVADAKEENADQDKYCVVERGWEEDGEDNDGNSIEYPDYAINRKLLNDEPAIIVLI